MWYGTPLFENSPLGLYPSRAEHLSRLFHNFQLTSANEIVVFNGKCFSAIFTISYSFLASEKILQIPPHKGLMRT